MNSSAGGLLTAARTSTDGILSFQARRMTLYRTMFPKHSDGANVLRLSGAMLREGRVGGMSANEVGRASFLPVLSALLVLEG